MTARAGGRRAAAACTNFPSLDPCLNGPSGTMAVSVSQSLFVGRAAPLRASRKVC